MYVYFAYSAMSCIQTNRKIYTQKVKSLDVVVDFL